MAWMEHGVQISLKRYALSMEDKMAAVAFECATNYGRGGPRGTSILLQQQQQQQQQQTNNNNSASLVSK